MKSTRYITTALTKLSLLSLLLFSSSLLAEAETPTVLVSIKPLHSLISHITHGVNQTHLLISQQQSAHHFQLRPSQKRLINQADIFFYSNDNIESFVAALKETTADLKFIELSRIPKIQTLAVRSFHKHHDSHDIDGHIWLSIENAKIIATYASQVLSDAAPQYANIYNKNLQSLLLKLDNLLKSNRQILSPFSNTPFMVYHDAFQYFELENQLQAAHFITIDPDHAPGIKRVRELRKIIKSNNIKCIFYEPPNIPPLLNTLTENRHTEISAIDPIGSQLPAGKSHYFNLLEKTAHTLNDCLNK